MRGASRKAREPKTRISLLFAHAGAKLQLLLLLLMFHGIAIAASVQRTGDTRDCVVGRVALATMSPSSSTDSSEDEYADLKLSHPLRRLAYSVGLSPNTTFHLCWDFNFLLMMVLIFWKGGPLLKEALQMRSRSIRRAIDAAQRLAEDAAKRLADVEKRWAKLDSEIAAIQALAEVERSYEEQVLNAKMAEDIRRIMEYSQSEIDRAGQRARCELRAFAADLAVSLARESIHVDKRTDEELVTGFADGLGDQQAAQATGQAPALSSRELVART
jgi:F-type H+-transporting ATPase subunit b